MEEQKISQSPRWSSTAKLVVALVVAALFIVLIFRFKDYVAPLLLSFVLAYIIHPIASFFNTRLKIPWRVISTLIYLVIFLCVFGLLTWGGISIFDQIQNLVGFLQGLVADLPKFFTSLSIEPLKIGPFLIDLTKIDLNAVWVQLQSTIQPMLAKVGTLIGSFASGAASTITMTVFILLISYFIMAESKGARNELIRFRIPSYQEDINRLGKQLSQIWNAFLRGQLIIFLITVTIYSILLTALGVRYSFLLAILAGLARFVPYIGPLVAWSTYALVAWFQVNQFNLLPFPYALIVVGCAMVTDVILDNYVSPRVMSNALQIHPAAVLVTVLLSASLFGFIGVLLAAPVLASLKLLTNYILRKLMDLDPWEGLKTFSPPIPLSVLFKRIKLKINRIFKKKESTINTKEGQTKKQETDLNIDK